MIQKDIRQTVKEFLDMLENGQGDETTNVRSLELALDQLALAYHYANCVFEEGHPEPPGQDYDHWRAFAKTRFPMLGYYNIPSKITEQIMEAEMWVGDALDDVADIACDLSVVAWCWTHTSENDALWHFRAGFKDHWGEHLRNLQTYLRALHDESA